jgi:formate C-acetyltransferase
MSGIKNEAEHGLTMVGHDDIKADPKKRFLQATIISCDAVISYANRYAEELGQMAHNERDAKRKDELLRIKKVLETVPANPAGSFHEAIQSIWILDLVLHQVIGARSIRTYPMSIYQAQRGY